MKASRRIAAVALAAAIPFTLSACGTSQATQAKKVIKAEILKINEGAPTTQISDAQAGCIGNKVVDKIGVKRLIDDQILTKDGKSGNKSLSDGSLRMPDADATDFVNAIFDCTDNGKPFVSAFTGEATNGASQAVKDCLTGKIDATLVKKILTAEVAGSDMTALKAQFEDINKVCASAH